MRLKAFIFDLDGVITQTASVHAIAWERMFNDFLKSLNDPSIQLFSNGDYLKYVDGKPRMEGVQCFLRSRNINLPWGNENDSPDTITVCGLGNRKNEQFQKVLSERGADVYQTTIDLVKQIIKKGYKVGVASSSKNCETVLKIAKIRDLFETVVDGVVSSELKLRGKPEPDIFITAAKNLGVLNPKEAIVVEDAVSGVQAGRNGNFGLVLGIARHKEHRQSLKENGADIVVDDLGDISLEQLETLYYEKNKE